MDAKLPHRWNLSGGAKRHGRTKLTQTELARATNRSPTSVSRVLNRGCMPSVSFMMAAARALGLTLDEFCRQYLDKKWAA